MRIRDAMMTWGRLGCREEGTPVDIRRVPNRLEAVPDRAIRRGMAVAHRGHGAASRKSRVATQMQGPRRLADILLDEFIVASAPRAGMALHGLSDLLQSGDILLQGKFVDLAHALTRNSDTPVDHTPYLFGARYRFVPGVAELPLDSDLRVLEREDAKRVGQFRIALVLVLEANLDVLANIEIFVVIEIHGK